MHSPAGLSAVAFHLLLSLQMIKAAASIPHALAQVASNLRIVIWNGPNTKHFQNFRAYFDIFFQNLHSGLLLKNGMKLRFALKLV